MEAWIVCDPDMLAVRVTRIGVERILDLGALAVARPQDFRLGFQGAWESPGGHTRRER